MEDVERTKKACIRDIGKKKFGFDYSEEIIKYKYLIGEKMSGREWKNLKENEKFNSYFEWEASIKENNKQKTGKQLKEFDHYLDSRINMIEAEKEQSTIGYSVILASIISAFVTLFANQKCTDKIIIKGNLVFSIPSNLVVFICVTLMVIYLISKVQLPVRSIIVEETLLKEYKKIIEEMLKENINNKNNTTHHSRQHRKKTRNQKKVGIIVARIGFRFCGKIK